MKLKFEKNENGEISARVAGKDFSPKDYIEMVKEIKNNEEIEVEFGEGLTEEEMDSVNSMIEDINNITTINSEEIEDSREGNKVELDDVPF